MIESSPKRTIMLKVKKINYENKFHKIPILLRPNAKTPNSRIMTHIFY